MCVPEWERSPEVERARAATVRSRFREEGPGGVGGRRGATLVRWGRMMLAALRQFWWRIQGWLAQRRHRTFTRRLAAGNPIEAHLTELAIQAEERGIESLTARQHLVVRTWNAHGVIGNGGFRFLLECGLPLGPVADGYRTLGFGAAAAACERVMRVVAAAPGVGLEARRAAAVEEPAPNGFLEEDRAIFGVEWDALDSAIGDFMRSHPRDFPGLPPSAR